MPGLPWNVLDLPLTDDRRAEQPLERVDVVDRVLEHRAGSGLLGVGAPGGAVHPLHGEELVVAQHRGLDAAAARILDLVLELEERRAAAEHEPDLVHHAGGRDRRRPSPGRRRARWRAASRRTPAAPRSTAAATRRGCSLVQVHTYTASTASSTASSLSIGCGARCLGERGRSLRVDVVHRRDHVVGARPVQALAVVGGDQPRAQEPDPDGHVFCTVRPPSTGITAPVMKDAAGSTSESVIWATSSGSP